MAPTTMTSVTEPAAEHQIDIHTTAGRLADLRKRTDETLHPVGEAAVEKVHAKGKLTARERIYALLDEGVVSLGLYSRIFRNNILASGVIPQ
ncbi:MAG: propionyl-CoA carboxylase beta chain, partial [Mycobacterium sp.]|nr:propionyl-CoA carboxylase beta chain [Mycobacterium sp.]